MLRRYRPDLGTRLCGGCGSRLARQEHDADRRKTWDVVFPGRNLDDARTATGCIDPGSLRNLRAMYRSLSDWRNHGAAQTGCAALHLLSHDRIEKFDPARAAAVDRRSNLWL